RTVAVNAIEEKRRARTRRLSDHRQDQYAIEKRENCRFCHRSQTMPLTLREREAPASMPRCCHLAGAQLKSLAYYVKFKCHSFRTQTSAAQIRFAFWEFLHTASEG